MQNSQYKIAIIEDDHAISAMYQYKLNHFGYTVQVAFDGQAGLTLAERLRPDLILLDLRMPVMGGVEMLEKLRSTDWGGAIRVIILTNLNRNEAPMNLRLLNVDRYIIKAHHTPQQVLGIIQETLDR